MKSIWPDKLSVCLWNCIRDLNVAGAERGSCVCVCENSFESARNLNNNNNKKLRTFLCVVEQI